MDKYVYPRLRDSAPSAVASSRNLSDKLFWPTLYITCLIYLCASPLQRASTKRRGLHNPEERMLVVVLIAIVVLFVVCTTPAAFLSIVINEDLKRRVVERHHQIQYSVQGGWGGWPTGNGEKLNSSQAQLGQATCLAVAYSLSISCRPSTPSALYSLRT